MIVAARVPVDLVEHAQLAGECRVLHDPCPAAVAAMLAARGKRAGLRSRGA